MFSGIVEEMGTVNTLVVRKNLSVLKVKAKKVFRGLKMGDSVSVNGACLTVTGVKQGVVTFDMMKETLEKTSLGDLKKGQSVNLERALRANARLNGHFVTGHVDAVGSIKDVVVGENYIELKITVPRILMKYIVEKGSVCVDGVSLTVGMVKSDTFSVYLIPFTKDVTTLGAKVKEDSVNIETDILAKYILNKD